LHKRGDSNAENVANSISTSNKKISQLKLPAPSDTDPHRRLLLDGYNIHACQ